MIRDLEAEIINILNTVPGVTVYGYEPKVFPTLPAVTLAYQKFDQAWRSYGKHDVTYTWEIRLYVGISDAKTSLDQVKDLVNQYINAFRTNPTLSGKARIANIVSGSLEVVTDVQNPYYLHTFQLEAVEQEG